MQVSISRPFAPSFYLLTNEANGRLIFTMLIVSKDLKTISVEILLKTPEIRESEIWFAADMLHYLKRTFVFGLKFKL